MPNIVERAIAAVFRRVSAVGGPLGDAEAVVLATCMLVLRGGKALEADVEADCAAWVRQHGYPDRDKLERWAAALGVEAAVAEAAVRTRRDWSKEV